SELAYRPGGVTGLNLALEASRSNHLELGAKFRPTSAQQLDVALFGIRTRDEIVVDTNSGGRTTFRHARGTERQGAEVAWLGRFGRGWSARMAYSWLDASFRDGFDAGAGPVAAGNRLPGVPGQQLFAEIDWTPDPRSGPFAGAELVRIGR